MVLTKYIELKLHASNLRSINKSYFVNANCKKTEKLNVFAIFFYKSNFLHLFAVTKMS